MMENKSYKIVIRIDFDCIKNAGLVEKSNKIAVGAENILFKGHWFLN